MYKSIRFIICSYLILFILVGCGTPSEPNSTPTLENTQSAPTKSPEPTSVQPTLQATSPSRSGKVDIGGRFLYYKCMGEGSPAVIIESGWGAYLSDYYNLMVAISKYSLVCAYDRAGLGNSDPVPKKPRTSKDMVDDLHALLTNVPIPGPYILAGHSLGGFNIRLYASQFPEDVVGMVFIEGIHPDQFEQCDLPIESPGEDASFAKMRGMCKSTIENWSDWSDDPEALDYFTSAEQVRATGSFGDLPLIVLVADANLVAEPGTAEEFQATLTEKEQHELAELSSQSQYVVIKDADHFSILNKQATYDAIIEMIDTIRNR